MWPLVPSLAEQARGYRNIRVIRCKVVCDLSEVGIGSSSASPARLAKAVPQVLVLVNPKPHRPTFSARPRSGAGTRRNEGHAD